MGRARGGRGGGRLGLIELGVPEGVGVVALQHEGIVGALRGDGPVGFTRCRVGGRGILSSDEERRGELVE